MKAKPFGYIVVEACEDYEQVLGLDVRDEYPLGGVLTWVERGHAGMRTVFQTRKQAQAAIARTEHMRLAFGWPNQPEKKNCQIKPVAFVGQKDDQHEQH